MYKRVLEEGEGGGAIFNAQSFLFIYLFQPMIKKHIKYFEVTGKPENMTCSISKNYVIFKAWDNQEFL